MRLPPLQGAKEFASIRGSLILKVINLMIMLLMIGFLRHNLYCIL